MKLTISATSFVGLITGALAATAQAVGGYDDPKDFLDLFEDAIYSEDPVLIANGMKALERLLDAAEAADRGVTMAERVMVGEDVSIRISDPATLEDQDSGLSLADILSNILNAQRPETVTDEFGREAEAGVAFAAPSTEQDFAILKDADPDFVGKSFFLREEDIGSGALMARVKELLGSTPVLFRTDGKKAA